MLQDQLCSTLHSHLCTTGRERMGAREVDGEGDKEQETTYSLHIHITYPLTVPFYTQTHARKPAHTCTHAQHARTHAHTHAHTQ